MFGSGTCIVAGSSASCAPDPAGVLSFFVGFSPDGRWLVSATSSDSGVNPYHFWRVGTWELGRSIDGEGNGHGLYRPAFTTRRPNHGFRDCA